METGDKIHTWNHTRKGKIVGKVTAYVPGWVTIECTEDNWYAYAGETITVRESFLKEVAQ